MKKIAGIGFLLVILIAGCMETGNKQSFKQMHTIDTLIQNGAFKKADNHIRERFANDTALTDLQRWKLRFRQDLMKRIKMDFSANADEVRDYIKTYYPDLSEEQMREWEKSGALEMRRINGEKRYFRYAHYNLFRIDSAAKARRRKIDGQQEDPLKAICLQNTAEILDASAKKPNQPVKPVTINFDFTLTVDAGAVPEGETVRCWLPFPKEVHERQQQVELHSTNASDFVIAPENRPHRTLYMEKVAQEGKPVEFRYSASYVSYGQWFDMRAYKSRPYNTSGELYQKYTAEKPPHVVFTKRIKQLAEKITGNAKNPYEKVKRIYEWIDREIPWASALEYSTFWNIPEYVLDNRHGDCGMQTLLFITLARYSGIPAKWQSGWMMHPGEVNLHDWAEVYYPELGWVPVDQSFELQDAKGRDQKYFYTQGIDAYRLIVNDDWSETFYPHKIYPRSETVDFQRGEVEWRGGNLYFDQWSYNMDVSYGK